MADNSNLPQLALEQFAQRRRYWQDQRRAGKITAEEADARLFPWLALALRCGAPAEALDYRLPAMLAVHTAEPAGLSEAQARAVLADDQCPLDEALAVLAKARDAALAALTRNQFPDAATASRAADNAQALALMARAFPKCPPIAATLAQPERQAA